MGQAQVCCDESQETRPPQVATFTIFLLSPTTKSHFATMQSGFFDSLNGAREKLLPGSILFFVCPKQLGLESGLRRSAEHLLEGGDKRVHFGIRDDERRRNAQHVAC